jgi:hypothetical protein
MSEKVTSEVISRRRALSLLGLAALSLAVAPTVLTVSDAEAQPATPPTGDAQTGTERRQERRTRRTERRQERRTRRRERRQERRAGRQERRKMRRTDRKERQEQRSPGAM